jgi:hypothetical protein
VALGGLFSVIIHLTQILQSGGRWELRRCGEKKMMWVKPDKEKRVVDQDAVGPPAIPSNIGINPKLVPGFIPKLLRVYIGNALKALRLRRARKIDPMAVFLIVLIRELFYFPCAKFAQNLKELIEIIRRTLRDMKFRIF